jgi:predicted O-linked N-acetylglucosamine transferase (SPINDLY family)
VCSKCLKSTHLLHPVVPMNSLENLDFTESLQTEIDGALKEVQGREHSISETISKSIINHKIALRNHIMFIRENLRSEFDDFFNNLLQSVRKDWNLFTVEEVLIKETKRFNDTVSENLQKIIESGHLLQHKQDIKKFYETLSEAQLKVSQQKESWYDYEKTVQNLMTSLKDHSELEVIDGTTLKTFMAENMVMNYSNIEY